MNVNFTAELTSHHHSVALKKKGRKGGREEGKRKKGRKEGRVEEKEKKERERKEGRFGWFGSLSRHKAEMPTNKKKV